MSKYLALFAKAIGLSNPVERSHYELEKTKSLLASERGREMDSESTEPPAEEEDSTTESETEAIAFNEDIYILTGRKGK